MNVLMPDSIENLWRALHSAPEAQVYAGGTDLLVKHRAGLVHADTLICLERIAELAGVVEEGDEIVVGACTTHTRLLDSPLLAGHCAVLGKALRVLGSPPVRNMATIGGNICTASPAGDTLPPLYLLDGAVEVWSEQGRRSVPIGRFILGPGATDMRKGEIVGRVRLKKGGDYPIHHFEKVGQRKAMSIAIASFAAMVRTNGEGRIEKARLAWGSVGPTVVRSDDIDRALIGARLSMTDLAKILPLVRQSVAPIDDLRATAAYRKKLAANLVLRLATYGQA
jgi:xanthine dehydrogenase FAD-binding subunit